MAEAVFEADVLQFYSTTMPAFRNNLNSMLQHIRITYLYSKLTKYKIIWNERKYVYEIDWKGSKKL